MVLVLFLPESDKLKIRPHSICSSYVRFLPNQYEIHEWNIMEAFCRSNSTVEKQGDFYGHYTEERHIVISRDEIILESENGKTRRIMPTAFSGPYVRL